MLSKAYRILKYSAGALTVGVTTVVLYNNHWDVTSIGVVRFGRAACTVSLVAADYKLSLAGLDRSSDLYKQTKSKVHLRSAVRLRELCCVNGGVFIKVGQHLGALDYLLPKEYVDTMKVLHSGAPKTKISDIHQTIEEDFKKPVQELFQSFEEEPIGAASLAQVHRATLHDGTVVAIKVQHPRVKAHSAVDMATMELLLQTVAWMFPDFKLMWLAEETRRNLPLELDFVHEANNCEKVSKMLAHHKFFKAPRIYWAFTTDRVLTMEFCDGGQVNDKEYMKTHNISSEHISRNLAKLYSTMIFEHGYIHCDPHPGNVLVKKTPRGLQIVLLDHGLYQSLSDDFRVNYCRLWLSLLRADLQGIKTYTYKMGVDKLYPLFACILTGRSWDSVTAGIDKQQFTADEDAAIRNDAVTYLPEISEILNQVPREMLLILKTNDLLRGIESTLKTRADARSFVHMSRCCVRALYEYEVRQCETAVCQWRKFARKHWTLFLINVYSLVLKFWDSRLGRLFTRQSHEVIIM